MIKFITDFWPLFLGLVIGSLFGTVVGNMIVYYMNFYV